MKLIVLYIEPFDFVVLRYASGSLVLFALLLVLRKLLRMPPWRPTLLIGLTQMAGFQGFVQTALLAGGVGKVSLMAYTMPFWSFFPGTFWASALAHGMPAASPWRRWD